LFWKPRKITRGTVTQQLSEFKEKRASGMGNIFGPDDAELRECKENKNKRLDVINRYLIQWLDTLT
jgi:hypothetical protein